jgi:hypothetical protein
MDRNKELLESLMRNPSIRFIFDRAPELGMRNWYLGSGGVVHTIWNDKHGFEPEYGIKDYDLVYYDPGDVSYEGEDVFIRRGKELFKDLPIEVEIKNQARVHLWYEKHFGYSIPQYKSAEEAISTWPTTATSIGVRREGADYKIFAPFGLDDIFGMIVRPNKKLINEKIYNDKISRWERLWPDIKIIPWNQE